MLRNTKNDLNLQSAKITLAYEIQTIEYRDNKNMQNFKISLSLKPFTLWPLLTIKINLQNYIYHYVTGGGFLTPCHEGEGEGEMVA